ncbi:MAG: hypothetical protein M3N54_04205 [Acidobacteriota bacterium]|nr:hypothetical protein [Acidobacteriota bacterium]
MSYISSNANRWYCAKESAYGHIPAITAANRIPAVAMTAQQKREKSARKDKTGSRTWAGVPQGMRRETTFGLTSYMRDWADMTALPPQGPLFESSLGAGGALWAGATPVSGDESTLHFLTPHGLTPGQAVSSAGEIRFVANVVDPKTVVVNAPFTTTPVPGVPLGATATYNVAAELPSLSVFDYWDPVSALQRVLCGGAIDRMTAKLNGDFHEFEFKGMAQDVVDSASFVRGQGGATSFPAEPAADGLTYSPVPGNLGQVWLGVIPSQFFTVSSASVEIRNNLNMRNKEYGFSLPQGINPGEREVLVSLELFSQDDQATTALYQAARQQDPLGVMFQMGQIGGQLMGIYLKSLIPDVPEFDDSDKRLKWRFRDTRAQGTTDDEIVVAFG